MSTLKNNIRFNKHTAAIMYSVQNPFYRDPELLILNP
ncbi:hypothetical protein C8N26_2151 [Tenacibaculum lutimaris]|uniref:Uncharacterized protein n=1 Tax=Tenacibaculum lutimaris TaxID=285258 RepID=A0A420DZ94_9FLAO|nr:hypothetical protein C8N26_2151 [Tenacibaculum lutimaris]